MPTVVSKRIFAAPTQGPSAPDSITVGGGSIWVEYGNGASSTGGQTSTIIQYSTQGKVLNNYTAAGLADGMKYDPVTGNVWVLNNNDGNSTLQLIDPATGQMSLPRSYGAPYAYGADSARGYDDVAFDKGKVFMSMTNPVNPGDPVVQELTNGNAPFGTLYTTTILSFGDMGINLATGQLATLPVTDPDSLKTMPDGSLVLTGEADGALIFIHNPGAANQTTAFLTLPAGDTPDDAIAPGRTSGTFYISNQGGNDVIAARVTGLNPNDLYVDLSGQNELVQVDPTTGAVTPIITGLNSPHGLAFIPDPTGGSGASGGQPGGTAGSGAAAATIVSTHIVATAPAGDSSPDSITVGGGSIWVEYGNGASSSGGQTSQIVQYGMNGQVQNTYTAAGLADGLKYNPVTGDVWVLNNNDGNSTLQLIDPATRQISPAYSYGAPYVYGVDSSRGYDDTVFDKGKVFLSMTNPANPGDPVVQELTNGYSPFGTLQTTTILSFGDTGTNTVTGQTAALPISDPDSLKLMPNGSLVLTSEADHALIFINNPGQSDQTASFVTLPAADTPDDAIMPGSASGTFYIANDGGNDIVSAHATGLNPADLYVDIYTQNELAQVDPTTGKVTPILTGLNNPHGLAFIAGPSAADTAGTPLVVQSVSSLGQLPAALSGASQMAAPHLTPSGASWTTGMSPGAAIGSILTAEQGNTAAMFPIGHGA